MLATRAEGWHRKKIPEGLTKKKFFITNNPSVNFVDSSPYTVEPLTLCTLINCFPQTRAVKRIAPSRARGKLFYGFFAGTVTVPSVQITVISGQALFQPSSFSSVSHSALVPMNSIVLMLVHSQNESALITVIFLVIATVSSLSQPLKLYA